MGKQQWIHFFRIVIVFCASSHRDRICAVSKSASCRLKVHHSISTDCRNISPPHEPIALLKSHRFSASGLQEGSLLHWTSVTAASFLAPAIYRKVCNLDLISYEYSHPSILLAKILHLVTPHLDVGALRLRCDNTGIRRSRVLILAPKLCAF